MAAKKTPTKKAAPKKPAPKKPATKKSPPKKTSTKKPRKKVMKKANTRTSSHRTQTILDADLETTVEEVEEYLLSCYDEEMDDFKDLPLRAEMEFCHAFMANGFKGGPAYSTVYPDKAKANASAQAQQFLSRPRVKCYLAKQLYAKRLRLGITSDWVCKKYLAWANLDITQFLDLKTKGRGIGVYLKKEINELPPLVRQSIKSISYEEKSGKIKVEFIDQKAALDSLVKLLGYTNDALINIDTDNSVHLHFDAQDREA